MKKLEELGIDPAPWEYEGEGEDATSFDVICHLRNGLRYQIAAPYLHFSGSTEANARLIAAAPELYDCLREAIVEHCYNCEYSHDGYHHRVYGEQCQREGDCFVKRWRKALAKAAGEECE